MLHRLGQTRSRTCSTHILQTPDTFVRAALPGMVNANAVVHVSPAGGARFTEYTAEFEVGGRLGGPVASQRFIYVLEGTLRIEGRAVSPGGYAYLPPSVGIVEATTKARAEVFEKPYQALSGVPPHGILFGREQDAPPVALNGDPWLEVRTLLPADFSFDFAVNTMKYHPGASLSMVEVHVMEHGMLMLEGGGIYRLADDWYAVDAGDFIWMAAYCPQWFGAIGKTPAKYLIYKDWNR